MKKRVRCAWVDTSNLRCIRYHDREWGIPVHNDAKHLEMLILEGAQAGLSWTTILNKRRGYRKVFKQFSPEDVAAMSDAELEVILHDPSIIRNRRKVYSARQNAKVFTQIQQIFGSFDQYIWAFVEDEPIINAWSCPDEIPSETEISRKISKDLRQRGMSFVGPTIIYAYMQAAGLVWDHTTNCFLSPPSP